MQPVPPATRILAEPACIAGKVEAEGLKDVFLLGLFGELK